MATRGAGEEGEGEEGGEGGKWGKGAKGERRGRDWESGGRGGAFYLTLFERGSNRFLEWDTREAAVRRRHMRCLVVAVLKYVGGRRGLAPLDREQHGVKTRIPSGGVCREGGKVPRSRRWYQL